jgi:DNA-binding NtrC family response regulator
MNASQAFLGRILVVDDDPIIRELLSVALDREGFAVTAIETLTQLRTLINQRFYDAVLLDLFLENEDGLEALPFLVRESPYTKVLMMSAHGTVELAVNAMESGASAFISKSKNAEDIVRELKNRLKIDESRQAVFSGHSCEHGIIGASPAIEAVLRRIDQVKNVDSTVLIVGESGTGKELVARAIHNSSARKGGRFEAINCGAIPSNLLESELFGHKRGAFTDAKADRKGMFEICQGGSLLLDEIGEMPFELQVKLLRVLQEKVVMPIGSSSTVHVDARVIAATNRVLQREVQNGKFREDLYFRLAVLTVELPPLRDRRTDIPLLISHFLEKMNNRFGKEIKMPSKDLQTRLMAYDWPGNIRELQNAIERGVVLSSDGELRIEDMLQPLVGPHGSEQASDADIFGGSDIFMKSLSEAKKDFEKTYLKQLLEITRGNISEIARISGRYRADIYRLLAKHGVEWEEFRP